MNNQRLACRTLFFAITSLVLGISQAVISNPIMLLGVDWSVGSVVEFILTPIGILGTFILLYTGLDFPGILAKPKVNSKLIGIIFLVSALLFIYGNGLHISSNTISNQLTTKNCANCENARNTVFLFDEVISHWVWYAGILGMALGAVILQTHMFYQDGLSLGSKFVVILAAILFAFILFLGSVEGGVSVLPVLLLSIVIMSYLVYASLTTYREFQWDYRPVSLFFGLGLLFFTFALLIYALIFQGIPEFSELGWF